MNLQFKNTVSKTLNDKVIYDLTIQDLDGEIADGQEIPFSYVFGQEPTSVLETYISDHIEELKALAIPDTFESELSKIKKNDDEIDEFTKFFEKAQEKIQEINKRKIETLEIGVEYKNDMFSSSHESFSFITNAISYYDSLIVKKINTGK